MPKFAHSPFLLLSILLITLSSCASLLGLNPNNVTPSKAGKYPEFTLADSLLGGLSPERTCYDVRHYALDMQVDPAEKSLQGTVEISYDLLAESTQIQVDLKPPMQITSVTQAGQSLNFSRTEGAYFIEFENSLKARSDYKLKIGFEGIPQEAKRPPWSGGLVWKKDKNGKPWAGVACEGDGASIWWPLKDHIYDEPDSVSLIFHVPDQLKVISNGVLKDSVNGWHWETSYPINPYNITFYAGDFAHFELPYDSMHNLDFYVLPYNLEKAKSHFEQTADIIRFFESVFGEYPWWEDGFKLVESPYAGMEHQTAIAYGSGYKNAFGWDFDYIILHEAAHEWWGNSVSASDFADIWLHEGFATYAEAMYVEDRYGYDSYLSYLLTYRDFIKNKRPVVGPSGVSHFDYRDSDPYVKGAWVLHSLRTLIGKEQFFELMYEFCVRNRMKVVSSADFIALAESLTERELDWFFDQYLYRREVPVLRYTVEEGNTEDLLHFRWTDTGSGFRAPVPININGNTEILPAETKPKTLKVPRGSTLIFSSSAYYYRTLRVDRTKDL